MGYKVDSVARENGEKRSREKLFQRLPVALYAIIAMYFIFMILDRALSLIFGFNFQPYGAHVPPGFTLWGHLFNGSMAIFGVWVMLKIWGISERSGYRWFIRAAVVVLGFSIGLWMPYNNDASYLISRGVGDVIPLYTLGNAIYVLGAGVVTLRLFSTKRRKAAFLIVLLLTFLFVHFFLYAPMFPEFQWT